jgi:hypothetical protein
LAFHSGREADHSPPSGAGVEEWVELYLHSPNAPSWRGAQVEHRDNFTLLYLYVTMHSSFSLFLFAFALILCTGETLSFRAVHQGLIP